LILDEADEMLKEQGDQGGNKTIKLKNKLPKNVQVGACIRARESWWVRFSI